MQVFTTKERDYDSSKSVLPYDNMDLACGTWEDEVSLTSYLHSEHDVHQLHLVLLHSVCAVPSGHMGS